MILGNLYELLGILADQLPAEAWRVEQIIAEYQHQGDAELKHISEMIRQMSREGRATDANGHLLRRV